MLIHDVHKSCWAWNRVYVKANGRVPCWCDTGEQYTIVHKPFGETDFIREVVNSPEMCDMRTRIIFDNEYYIPECKTCCCMTDATRGEHFRFADAGKVSPNFNKSDVQRRILERVRKQRGWQLGSIDKIIEIQLEPSFPCNLACPGCLQGIHSNPMSTEVGPYVFPYEWFEMMIDSIISNNVHLNRIVYVGRGEPTLNRQLSKMILLARQRMPSLQMSMDTNSNQAFLDEYLQLDWINCSIDGCDQDSYSKYRKGGQYSKAIDFMRNGVNKKLISKSKCAIKWKYILFDTNDADIQLNKAQSTAEELGIDELNFIITHTGAYDGSVNPSQRFKTVSDLNTYLSTNKIFSRTSGSRAT